MTGIQARKVIFVLLMVNLLAPSGWIGAADPPNLINYQGVLRDNAGQPLDGDHDMIFRFFDAASGGVEILVDEHRATGSGAVTATGGLFSVELGGGAVSDGAGPGTYTDLGQVFADHAGVWVEITIDAGIPEVLSPRVRIVASAYAMNARWAQGAIDAQNAAWSEDSGMLGGRAASGYIDTSSATQTKNGRFYATSLHATDNYIEFGHGPHMQGSGSELEIFGGSSAEDDLFLTAGYDQVSGQIALYGGTYIDISAGNGNTRFRRASDDYVTGLIGSTGNLMIKGDFELGADSGDDDDGIIFDGVETILWSNAETRFEMSDELALSSGILVGSTTAAPVGYNRFGTMAAPTASADITNVNDVMIASDLEVADVAYVGTSLVVGDPTPTTNQAFSSFGDPYTISTLIDSSGDVLVSGQLQVDGHVIGMSSFSLTTDGNGIFRIDDDDNSSARYFAWFHDTGYSGTDQVAELTEAGHFRIGGTLSQNYTFDVAESFLAEEGLQPGDLVSVSGIRGDSVRKSLGVDDGTVLGVVSTTPGVLLGSAPFHADGLGEVWGDEIRQEYLAVRSTLRSEILESNPEFANEIQEIESLEGKTGAPSGEAGRLDSGNTGFEDRRTRIDDDIENLALQRFFEKRTVPVALAGRVPVKVDGSYGAIAPGDALVPSPIPGVAMKAGGGGPVIGIALQPYSGGLGKVLMFVQRGGVIGADRGDNTLEPAIGEQVVPSGLDAAPGRYADDPARFSVFRDGDIGGPLESEVFRVDDTGNVFARGAFRPRSMDVAEYFPLSEPVEPGDILAVDRDEPTLFRKAHLASDRAVVGVVASDPGVILGGDLSRIAEASPEFAERLELARAVGDREEESELWELMLGRFYETHAAVAMVGTVNVKVDAGYGVIEIGDLLVSSPTPGHAMRTDDPLPGTVIGKALEAMPEGMGIIRALVSAPAR